MFRITIILATLVGGAAGWSSEKAHVIPNAQPAFQAYSCGLIQHEMPTPRKEWKL